MKAKSVSVVIPAMNEAGNIGLVLDEVQQVVEILKDYVFEIIVVDDHSADGTADIARARNARLVNNAGPKGKGQALIAGFAASRGDYIVMMDADFSHQPADMPLLLEKLDSGAGMVIGSRIYGGSDEYTRIRAFGNITLTLAFGMLHKRYLSDALNGYKAFKRDVFDKFKYTSRDFEIEIELLVNALRLGHSVVEVPSHERARKSGQAKSKVILHGTKFLLRIIKEWMRNKIGLK